MNRIRIATRESPLALWQAEHVAAELRKHHPELLVELLPMTTTGDQLQSGPLTESGGKGLFVKELEYAMLDGRADIAVHSMKDVPAQFPDGLGLSVVLAAEDPRDAWLSASGADPMDLPEGARVGTASLRRQSQLLCLRPDLRVETLRGNVQTRLAKLERGDFDAILLACAGLRRLGLESKITRPLEINEMLPAPGQGIVGIESELGNQALQNLLQPLSDRKSEIRIEAERGFSVELSGNCRTPLAAHTLIENDQIRLFGCVAAPDGSRQIRDAIDGDANLAANLALSLAQRMRAAGADEILALAE